MISIPTNPWIKKFADHQLGNPITLTGKKTLHLFIKGLLFRTGQYAFFSPPPPKRHLPLTIYIQTPNGYQPGQFAAHRLILIHQFLETLFLEQMHHYIQQQPHHINRRPGPHNLKVQLEQFVNQFGIKTEEDITQDNLIKMYYRYRTWLAEPETPNPKHQTRNPLSFTTPALNTLFANNAV